MGPVAAAATGRHPSVVAAARWLDVNPALPVPVDATSQVFATAALALLADVSADGPELTKALDALTIAKDHGVRARRAQELGG